ncbi:phage antirepressor KilAC domain-containing protein [Rhodovulum sp. MB263]|uniref:phage antirepressor KilAC domain-containing protein n=1 Tax=Rhodovulum sp. (strain MB263) TaxID=308754 RepID=UPI0018C89FAD|nr:phage antirepressor KilAC domain-containing protein [Rhodovulum sp. MB263]
MSSREIAELLEVRHDNVKRTVERLAEKGVIVRPPMEDEPSTDGMGRTRMTRIYHLEKRDSYVVVAQLSPEFTARVVDRWQELEAARETFDPSTILESPAAMRGLLLSYTEKVIALEAQADAMREDVEAHERLTKADGSLNVTEAAKALGVRPKDLFAWLSENGWLYKRPGAASWLGYQSKCNMGLLEHKTTTVLRADGSEKITEQVRVTPKGLSRLAKLIPGVAKEVQ